MALNKAKIYTITSVKGGSGKTTTLLNLAGTFSLMEKKVLILDFDLYTGSIAASLNVNVKHDMYNLYFDYTTNNFNNLEDYVISYNDYISLIASPKDPRMGGKIDASFLNFLLYKASLQYDIILIDTTHYLNEINLIAYDESDKIVYVINNDPMTLKNMRTMTSILNDMEWDKYLIVLNNSIDKDRNYFSDIEIKNIIKRNIDYIIPSSFYLKNIDKYIINGEILTLNKGIRLHNKKAIRCFQMIACRLLDIGGDTNA